ncbi:hypothetical protein, partial [Nocardia abscessus]|uniref:hypothetical protein n=1 Tax=Nocardia abscessus TaxID=120957 RepID=UPI002456E85F
MMTTDTNDALARAVAIATGPPLSDEPGLGPLTLPGFLREVTERYSHREALVAGRASKPAKSGTKLRNASRQKPVGGGRR